MKISAGSHHQVPVESGCRLVADVPNSPEPALCCRFDSIHCGYNFVEFHSSDLSDLAGEPCGALSIWPQVIEAC